ncbi:periplasmic binding protein/LacI transcriptional regulator [Paenibacillus curdlanolyticus YK9]|uniref:Periplasmic binding protein/LacI transcriptional regulator n=1 Tax=Paenibacillus curdlanolyticus YK9 TaxID=717606 RepID=E0IA69_9BACL|nr:substrate-binding domain-containing protein [Paenibacillus curdlanolyticus]EFM10646.1 periplasmic binding protein/LacI transcriptional regulator [Paenibacillus curdlanolyticus YK9]
MQNRIWNVGLIILAITFAGLLSAFAITILHTRELAEQLEHKNGPAASIDQMRVALISQELDNPFWRSVETGARTAATEYGMELTYMGPLRINPSEQSRLLEKAIAQGFDALLVQGLNDPVYARLIGRASASGIPVITIDADEPGSKRLAYVGTDNWQAGEAMGQLVTRMAGQQGRIGVLLGSEATNMKLRLAGFRSVVNKTPGLSIADVRISNISRLQATEQTTDMLNKHPKLLAVVGFSALDGVGIAEAVAKEQASDQPRVFAFDDLANTRQAIRECRITAALVQQPARMGQKAIELLHDYMQNGEVAAAIHFTKTNVLDELGACR